MLYHRWPDATVKELEEEEPTSAMTADDAADLGRCRRGVEPLRIVILPHGHRCDDRRGWLSIAVSTVMLAVSKTTRIS